MSDDTTFKFTAPLYWKYMRTSGTRLLSNHLNMMAETWAISQESKDNISSFPKKRENQSYDDWATDKYKEEKTKAKDIYGF